MSKRLLPFNTRVLQSLSGRLMYRKAETFMRKLKRNQREAKIWAGKFGSFGKLQ